MAVITTELDESVASGDLEIEEAEDADDVGGEAGVENAAQDGTEAVEGVRVIEPRPVLMTRTALASDDPPDLSGLRDAGEASFEPVPRQESVIGDDGRRRISPADKYPWRAHCALRITARDGSQWVGTAFFIAPRVLATAGHCVFIHSGSASRHGWARQIEVMPGRDGASLPYGTAVATRFYSVRGWTENRDDEYDYGVIILSEPLGSRTGWLGYGTYSDGNLVGRIANLSGYPQDRGNGTEQWYMAGRIASVGTRKVYYPIDSFGGQSGSAVYRIINGSRFAVGIHAYGVDSTGFNSATRISRPVFDNLKAWKAAHP